MKPRRTCYSDECLKRWREVNDPAYIRYLVDKRDHGICALCGVDTNLQEREGREWLPVFQWLVRREAETIERQFLAGEVPGEFRDACCGYRWSRGHVNRLLDEHQMIRAWGHVWEADHIVPVIEGGGGCGLEGYRTLCLVCHRIETSKLAARRAARRRAASQAGQPMLQL